MVDSKLQNTKFLSSFGFYIRNGLREMTRRKLYYALALFSCTIVVTATSVAQTVIEFAPIIFLRTAESNSGNIDVQLDTISYQVTELMPVYSNNNETQAEIQFAASFGYNLTANPSHSSVIMGWNVNDRTLLFNLTQIRASTVENFITARSTFNTSASAPYSPNCGPFAPPYPDQIADSPYIASEIFSSCVSLGTNLILLNNSQEAAMGLGDNTVPTLANGSCAIHQNLANLLNITTGQYILVQVDLSTMMSEIAYRYDIINRKGVLNYLSESGLQNVSSFVIPYQVQTIFGYLSGKFADGTYKNYILVEDGTFLSYAMHFMPSQMVQYVNSSQDFGFASFVASQHVSEYASNVIFNLPNRMSIYSQSNYDNIQMACVQFATNIAVELGIFPFDMSLPVLAQLQPLQFGALTLGITLNIIIFVLFILSIILIYNLLLVSIETKTFEMGVLRMLGLDKLGLAQLILIQAFTFVLPGVILGLILSVPVLVEVGHVLQSSLGIQLPTFPTGSAAAYSIGLGFAIPILSSFYPMRQALSQSLSQSLDLQHSKTSAVHVSIENDLNAIPWVRISFSIVAIAFGASVYYLLPLALLSFNIALLLSIFFWILMGFLVGMILLAMNVQHLLERIFVRIFYFYAPSSFRELIVKNLVGHKLRNGKTAMMYALSLGFVIFISVAADLEIQSAAYQVQQQHGVYYEITPNQYAYLDWVTFENGLINELTSYVDNWVFVTDDLNDFLTNNGYDSVYVTHIGQLYQYQAKIVGVSPQIFSATFSQYLKVSEKYSDSSLDLGYQLYTPRGSESAIIGSYYSKNLDLSLDDNSTFLVVMYSGQQTKTAELRVLAVLDASPAFTFSQIPSIQDQNILISIPTFARLAGSNTIQTLSDLPIKRLLIQVKNGDISNLGPISKYFDGLQVAGEDMTIWDFRDFQSTLNSDQQVITIIFIVVEVIVMTLCLFSLVSSMSTNILEQSKEIAVMRAIGVGKTTVNLLYVSEAFILVFTSSFLGLIIGTIVGWTMTLQQVLFTQLPIPFVFPYTDLFVALIVSVISAFFSSYLPAKNITKLYVARIMRLTA